MEAKGLTPILNVSNMEQSFAWFAKLGWQKIWEWGDPPGFAGVGSGAYEIFLCLNGQGGRGKSDLPLTFGSQENESADRGVWLSLWVDDVDDINERCKDAGIEVTWPPADMPWHVREMHIRHPDGHVFRVSQTLPHTHD